MGLRKGNCMGVEMQKCRTRAQREKPEGQRRGAGSLGFPPRGRGIQGA